MATIGELVLVQIDHQPAFYARIEDIAPDVKPGWWQVKLLVLTLPLQLYTWILDDSQVAGAPFTMGGRPIRLDPVVSPVTRDEPPPPPRNDQSGPRGKVVSLAERKKKDS